MITHKSLRRLAQRVAASRHRLVELVEQSAIRKHDAVMWGQFLDGPRRAGQYGMYGTSAAIQVLAAAGHTANSPLIKKALLSLPEVNPRSSGESLYDSSDLTITFKEAFILEAAQPGNDSFQDAEPIEQLLLSQLIDGHGWGNYCDTDDQDDSARLLPTSHALMALRRSRSFRVSPTCESVLGWLAKTTISDGRMTIQEAVLLLLVLIEYESPGISVASYKSARQHLLVKVTEWVRKHEKVTFGDTVSYHYWATSSGIQHNHYMFYVPDLIAALALLRAGNPPGTRQWVHDIVAMLCDNIAANGGFRSKASQRMAAMDQLWAFRLLQQFSETLSINPDVLLPPGIHHVSATRSRRLAASITLSVVGTSGTLMTVLTEVAIAIRTLGGVLATLCLGTLVSLLIIWLRGN